MPTLTTVSPNLLASVLEDSLFAPPATQTKVGYNFANFLTAGNESSDTDGFMITGVANTGKLYVNTGSTTAPSYKELVQVVTNAATQIQVDFAGMWALPGGATVVPVGSIELTVRLTGVFLDNTKISGSDSKLYWEPNLALDANGLQPAFYIRSADNTNSTWNDGGDLVSATNILVSINVTPVNDAPVFILGGSITVGEDSGAYGGPAIATSISPGGGADEAGQTVNMSVINNTNAALTGAVTVNNAGILSFTPVANANGSATITVQAMDTGGTANGGVDTTTHTFVINVTAVNDAPVNTVPGAQTTVANVVTFSTGNGNALSVSDVDAAAGSISTTLSVNVGTLAAVAASGATVTGSGTGSVLITGTLAAVNASLQGVTFTGTGDATLTMLTNDGGNTGAGPILGLSDTDTVLISVAPAVTSVTEPVAGVYSVANTLDPTYMVNFDSAVVVTGTPRIAITIETGGPTVYANYNAGLSTATSLAFTYDVLITHNDTDGIVAAGPIDLNGGSIKSPGGSNAVLTLVGLDPTPAVLVDNVAPTVPAALDLNPADDSNITTDNITNHTTALSISGTGENGSTVTLFDDLDSSGTFNGGDVTLGTATVAAGVWTIDAALAAGSTHNVLAFATDAALNVSAASAGLAITVDTAAPAVPGALNLAAADDTGVSSTDNITMNTAALSIDGTGENASTVTLFDDIDSSGTFSAGDVTLGTATVAAGVWTIDAALAAGTHSVHAFATDVAGNVSAASAGLAITVDTAAPAAPAGLDLIAASDTGSSSTDNITNDTTPTINGTGEVGATVTLTSSIDGVLGATAVVDGAGNWSITTGVLTAGAQSLTATQTDVAGNVSPASGALAITLDITAPAAPTDPDLAASDDSGASNTDNITNHTTGLTFTGTAEASSTVTLFNDADASGTFNPGDTVLGSGAASGAGAYSIDLNLAQGLYEIRAFATDAAGNAGLASATALTLDVTVDTTAPAAIGMLDLASADDSNINNDNVTNINTNLTLSGTAVANAVVTIYQDAVSIGSVTANGLGVFTYDVLGPVADATYAYTATQVDLAGNVSASSAALNVTVDTVGPAVTYNGAHYNAVSNVLTIEGKGFSGLGAADVTALVKANAAQLTWDTDGIPLPEYTLLAGDVVSATVVDDRTLVLVLGVGVDGAALETNGSFGTISATTLNPLDSIAITNTFVGTDLAGNPSTGSTLGIPVLGAQNEGNMPHTYSAALATATGASDDTLGMDAVASINLAAANFAGLTMMGTSAAQISASSSGSTYTLTQKTALNVGSGFGLTLSNVTGVLDTEITFADGSMLKDNTGALSNTLSGTANGDQLIAGANGDRLLGNAGNDLLVGGAGADAIYGGSGNDVIYGAGGNDYLSGGSGADTFIYTTAVDGEGYDVIYGFGANDVINVVGGANAAAMHALATQSGADTLITLNATETIRLLGVSAASLTDANFGVSAAFIKGVAI